MKTVIIEADKAPWRAELTTLKELQGAVGGYIELIPFGDKASAYINEEGKLHGLPLNPLATELCIGHRSIFPGDCIVGPMVVLGQSDEDGNSTDIPEDIAADLLLYGDS